ncbi:MAG: peptidylprolyl isomerase [Rickettsiales bacterium]|nr:peptidylprolyl isomerase [Rickettsiales bacterium]
MVTGLFMLASVSTAQAATPASDPENTLLLELKGGTVVIQLRPDLAPNHVARIKELTRKGFYNGIVFHRVIEGFMAQTGDPTGTGAGGSDLPDLKAEFNSAKHLTGTLSMARAGSPDSANSQFFICFKPSPFLDGNYTVFGQVVSGMEFVNAIKKGDAGNNGSVSSPDKIISLKVQADAEKAKGAAAPAASVTPAPAAAEGKPEAVKQ